MTEYPQTFAQWSAYGGLDERQLAIVNTLIDNDPFLGDMPLELWKGGKVYTWMLNSTLPTISAIDETDTLSATQVKRQEMKVYLSQYGGEVMIPVFLNSTMASGYNLEAEDMTDLVRSMGRKMSSEVIKGNYMDESSDVTIIGTGLSATPYVDAVTAISANMPTGYGGLKYVHSGTWLQFRAAGSTTWGTAVAVASDADYTLADGDDDTKKVTLTIDVTDLTADCELPGALLFLRPDEIAGLKELAMLDSGQVKTPSTDGDAVTLAILDELDELVLGPKSEKIYLMNARTRRAVKTLIAGAGGMQQSEYQDERLSKYSMNYEGVPVVASPNVVVTETQGSSSGNCGRIYCVRLNAAVGLGMVYAPQSGPNDGTATAVSDHDVEGGPIQLPVYLRRIGEMETKATFKWRITAALATFLKRSTSCAVRYGITS